VSLSNGQQQTADSAVGCSIFAIRSALTQEDHMPRGLAATKAKRMPRLSKDSQMPAALQHVLWRLDRLERQVRTLSELVRDHAEDSDRLVTIVAEDRDVLRRELLREHQAKLRVRKRARATDPDAELTSDRGT
jgi:hypothetical protein